MKSKLENARWKVITLNGKLDSRRQGAERRAQGSKFRVNKKGEAMNESRGVLPPGCTLYIALGGPPPSDAPELKVLLIFLAAISIVTFPFTAVLNALVIVAVKTKSRMRNIKSNILIASLATTDLMVGVIVQTHVHSVNDNCRERKDYDEIVCITKYHTIFHEYSIWYFPNQPCP